MVNTRQNSLVLETKISEQAYWENYKWKARDHASIPVISFLSVLAAPASASGRTLVNQPQ
jgi:hypothetical protein